MLTYFWTYYTDLPPGVGTPIFSPLHLVWLGTALLIIPLAVVAYRQLGRQARRRSQVVLAVLLALADVAILSWIAWNGHFTLAEHLPLHLCSAAIWIEFAAVLSGSPLLFEFSYCCCLPGALAAMLTPTWSVYPILNVQALESIFTHTLLMVLPAIWIWGDGFRPRAARLPLCAGILALLAAASAIVNHLTGGDYMFLSYPPAGSILVIFEKWMGRPGYLVPLGGLVLIVWVLLYTPWLILNRRSRAQRP